MLKRCPHCQSYGILKHRRAWWRRLARRPHTYSCIDCGRTFSREEALASTPAPATATLRPPLPANTGPGRRRWWPFGTRRFPRRLLMGLRLARLGPGAFSGLWQRLGIAPIEVWVIKQIDAEVLHLCGIGTLHTEQRPWRALTDLKRGCYCGGVRLGQTGIVLNSRLFAALIPLDSLHLEGPAKVRWQGRDWQVSRVPQRSWQYEGRLVAHPEPGDGQARLVSGEDVAGIRDNIDPDACPPGTATFQPGTHWGDPAISAWKARVRRHSKDDPH